MLNRIALGALVSCLLACGSARVWSDPRPGLPSGLSSGLSSNGESDAGAGPASDAGADPSDADAGPVDAGEPSCPALTKPVLGGCVPVVTVRLSGTAFARLGDTLIAGTGQQPVLQVFVEAPSGLAPGTVSVTIADPDGGLLEAQALAAPTFDDAGTHYDLAFDTRGVLEGTCRAWAEVQFGDQLGDGGFQSNPIHILADRTPPQLTLTVPSLDGGTVARNFLAAASLSADDGAGSGGVQLSLVGQGPQLTPVYSNRWMLWIGVGSTNFPLTRQSFAGSRSVGQSTIDGSLIPYDAWSTETDGASMTLIASGTDLAGNVASKTLVLPVTRELWVTQTGAGTMLTLGRSGEVMWGDSAGIHAVNPATAASLPDRVLDTGEIGVGGTAVFWDGTTQEVLQPITAPSVGVQEGFAGFRGYANTRNFWGLGAGAGSLAVSASTAKAYFVDSSCALNVVDLKTNQDSTGVSPGACTAPSVAVGAGQAIVASPQWLLSVDLPSLQPNIYPGAGGFGLLLGALVSTQALLPSAEGVRFLGAPGGLPTLDSDQIGRVTSVTVDSQGNVVVLNDPQFLTKLSAQGKTLWSVPLGGISFAAQGPVLTSDGMIYVVDGSQALNAFDAHGLLHWRSPPWSFSSAPALDHCNHQAYLRLPTAGLGAIALDSLQLDASPNSWPMPGHDVFQTYDAQGAADVDCANHL